MKKMSFALLAFLAILIIPATTMASNARFSTVNGVLCWHDDLNYPYVTMGAHNGCFIDVSSAYVVTNNNSKLEINVLEYFNWVDQARGFTSEQIDGPTVTTFTRYNTGAIFVNGSNVAYRHKDEEYGRINYKRINDAFYLIEVHLGLA